MNTYRLFSGLAALACASGLFVGKAEATQILVGQCVEFAACYSTPTPLPWSDTLSLTQLTDLGLSTNTDFVATQTSQFTIRLGVTTADFTTLSGPVVETLPEYNGTGNFSDPGPYQPPTVVGTFFIPDNATGLTISGTFGNSTDPNSAGVNLCLGSGSCSSAIPEASTWVMMLAGFAGLGGFAGYRTSRKMGALAA
jgi:hypothetical protein